MTFVLSSEVRVYQRKPVCVIALPLVVDEGGNSLRVVSGKECDGDMISRSTCGTHRPSTLRHMICRLLHV